VDEAPEIDEEPPPPPRRAATLLTPERAGLTIHLLSLVATLVILIWIDRGMWFRGDDFDFLAQRGLHGATKSIWTPHNEHWSTIPVLIWRAIFVFAKLHTARPYLIANYLAHLLLVHVLWRVMRQVGAGPFVSAFLAAAFALLGSGGENIVWAFQIGFVLSLLLGWVVALLANHEDGHWIRDLLAVLAGIAALMTSGVAVTMVVVGGMVAFARRGWLAALTLVGPCAAVYLVWYELAGHHGFTTSQGWESTLLGVPLFVWTGLSNALSAGTGSDQLGPPLFVAVALYALWRARDAASRVAPAVAGVAGSLVFFTIAAFGRDSGSLHSTTSRYVYVAIAMMLPAIGLGVSELVHRRRGAGAVAFAALLLVGIWNFGQLLTIRSMFVATSQQTERQLVAAAEIGRTRTTVRGGLPAGNLNAPNITLPVLEALYLQGDLPPGVTPQPADILNAATQIQLGFSFYPLFPRRLAAVDVRTAGVEVVPVGAGCNALTAPAAGALVTLTTTAPASMTIEPPTDGKSTMEVILRMNGRAGPAERLTLHTSTTWWDVAAAPAVVVLSLPAGATLTACGPLRAPGST
jgi:hypothetical protein